jgi:hypothetical protein
MNRGAEKPYLRAFARSLGEALPAAPTSIQSARDRLFPDAIRRQWVENLAGGNVIDQATRYPPASDGASPYQRVLTDDEPTDLTDRYVGPGGKRLSR